ncbi:hypothetical protein AYI68_g3543, partial [Smittium mucronatum]
MKRFVNWGRVLADLVALGASVNCLLLLFVGKHRSTKSSDIDGIRLSSSG